MAKGSHPATHVENDRGGIIGGGEDIGGKGGKGGGAYITHTLHIPHILLAHITHIIRT